MRIMGLDYGSKTVGVAISDPLLITAQGLETVQRKSENKLRQTLARLTEICAEYDVKEIVLGYPRNMNYTEGERCEKTAAFQELLEKRTGLPVIRWDERLTTSEAEQALTAGGVRREHQKMYLDKIAAALILQNYLDYRNARETGVTTTE